MLSNKITESSTDPYIKQLLDAGKRAADTINVYSTFYPFDDLQTKWLAIKIQDGSSDGVLYDSKREAVRHQLDERLCAYFSFKNKWSVNMRDMAIYIQFVREAYDAGFRLPDPDSQFGGPDVLMTAARHDDIKSRLGM